jgi:hypothetical protein
MKYLIYEIFMWNWNNFIYENFIYENFIYEIQYLIYEIFMWNWNNFIYENFLYEIFHIWNLYMELKQFHIWKFHIWNISYMKFVSIPYNDFIYEIFIYEMLCEIFVRASMHGVAVQPWSFFRKKYDGNPPLFLFILWIKGHLNILFLVYL